MQTYTIAEVSEVPEEWLDIYRYMLRYPSFYFSSARLSRKFPMSSHRISKVLLELSKRGYLDKQTRGNTHSVRSIYRAIKLTQ